ncbi:hypothetical protein Gorai_010023, partial [Gossypium raimondii]|nr:hypothetical protein [Gossypium raimondii]
MNQKNNSGNDQQTISQEDDNSIIVYHAPPPSHSNSSAMIFELSATTLPIAQVQAQSFEELAERNQSKGNLQFQACCYKQDSDLTKSGKAADAYTWKCHGTKGLIGNRRKSFYRCAHPGCQAKKSVERSLDGKSFIVHSRASHNHPKSLPTRTSSLSAFSHIRASNHLTIKIPDKSSVTYEGGQMDMDGLVFFVRSVEDETGLQNLMDKKSDQPSDRHKAFVGLGVRKAKTREMMQSFTGKHTNEVQEEKVTRGIPRKKAWDANLKEISGNDIHCVRENFVNCMMGIWDWKARQSQLAGLRKREVSRWIFHGLPKTHFWWKTTLLPQRDGTISVEPDLIVRRPVAVELANGLAVLELSKSLAKLLKFASPH